LDQHVCRIVREAFGPDRSDDVVLAEVFKILGRVLSAFDPERVVLRRFALVRDLPIKQLQPLLHRNQVCYKQG